MNKLVKQSLRILLGRATTSVFTLLFTVYFAYEFPKHIFALLGIYATIVNLSQVFVDLGLSTKVIREAPPLWYNNKKTEAIDTIIMPSTMMRIAVSGLGSLFLGVLWFVIHPDLSDEYPNLNLDYIVIVSILSLFFHNVSIILAPVFHLQKKFGNDSFLTGLATLLESVFSMVLYLSLGMNHFFLGYFIANALVFLLRFYLIREILYQFHVKQFTLSTGLSILKEYVPFYLRRIVRLGLTQADQLIVLILLPIEQFANFDLAKKLTKFLKFYIEAFTNPLNVKLAQTKDVVMRKKQLKVYYLFTIPPPIILMLISPWIMQIAGGVKYADSWSILTILYASYIFYSIASSQISVITILGKGTEALLRDAVGGMIGLSATFLFIVLFQEYGMAWGQLIAYITLCIVGNKIYKKYTKPQNETPVKV